MIQGRDLSSKVAIVTGGYSGIGLETTRAFLSAGANVIVPVQDLEKATKALRALPGASVGASSWPVRAPMVLDAVFEGVVVDHDERNAEKERGMKKRILVVEDDDELRSLMQELLEEEAYEVETAIDGVDACDHLDHQRNTYAAILLDLTMPRLNGLQILQQAQEHDPTLLRSIIAMSADEEALQQSAGMGISATLKKPFDPDVLLVLIGRAIG